MSSDQMDLGSLVAEVLLLADTLGHAMIEVEDLDGIITLKGTVESEQARLAAAALAQRQEGVVQVINMLKVSDPRVRISQ